MKHTNELVMEPRSRAGNVRETPAAVRSILFSVHDDDGLGARLQVALSLARACSAHLRLLQIIPLEGYTVVDAYGGTFVSGEIVEALEEQAAKVRNRLESHLSKEDVNWSYDEATSATLPELLRNGGLCDLMFAGRQPLLHELGRSGPELLGALVCNLRTPLCIPGDNAGRFDPFGTAIIAWNGSLEGANAVRCSIGLLKMASEVRVIRFTEDKEIALSDTRLLEYLSRHDVHAEVETHLPRTGIGDDLVGYASGQGAEYIVMGAYSHSRAGEFLFGGVTRKLLRACPVSLIMSH